MRKGFSSVLAVLFLAMAVMAGLTPAGALADGTLPAEEQSAEKLSVEKPVVLVVMDGVGESHMTAGKHPC